MKIPASPVTELQGADLGHLARTHRLEAMAPRLASNPTLPLPQLFPRDNGELQGAYDFLSNPEVSPAGILGPHQKATLERARGAKRVLDVQDTTVVPCPGRNPKEVGYLSTGKPGFYGHFSLLCTADGEWPLGVIDFESIVRLKRSRRGGRKLSAKQLAKYDDLESKRWRKSAQRVRALVDPGTEVVTVGDCEADSFACFSELKSGGVGFVLRLSKKPRRACEALESEDVTRLEELLQAAPMRCEIEVPLSARGEQTAPRAKAEHPPRRSRLAHLHVASRKVVLLRPRQLGASYPPRLELNVVRVHEPEPVQGEPPIEWWLATVLPIDTAEQVLDVVGTYRARWIIEIFFDALKQGCSIEARRLETSRAMLNLLATMAPIAWYAMVLRTAADADVADTSKLISDTQEVVLRGLSCKPLPRKMTARELLYAVAALGGHLKNNGRPGWRTLTRGLAELSAAHAGFLLGLRHAGQKTDQ